MQDMYAAVHAALAKNRGLITIAQAATAGLDERQVQRLLRTGTLVAVRRGVYTTGEVWQTLDEHRGRPLFRARAAHMSMRVPHVMSHNSSALELELEFLKPPVELVHITRPDVLGSRTTHGVKHHSAAYTDDQVITLDGIDLLEPARTAIDIAREHGYQHGVVACDSALRLGVTQADLEKVVHGMSCWPGIRGARAAVSDSDPGAESVGETLARLLVEELGFGRPQTQFPVRVGHRVFWVDLLLGCHGFEFDGKLKYRERDAGGVANRPPEEVVWDEKRRQDLICGEGLGMSRIVWSDLFEPARSAARARLRAEFDVSQRRFGTELPHAMRLFAEKHGHERRAAS